MGMFPVSIGRAPQVVSCSGLKESFRAFQLISRMERLYQVSEFDSREERRRELW